MEELEESVWSVTVVQQESEHDDQGDSGKTGTGVRGACTGQMYGH